MDIQKEREDFEQHLTDTGLVEFAGYGFAVDECDEYLHEPTQVAWDSWLIGLNRTKAQAVPEGFLLMPRKCTNKMAHAAKAVDGRLSAFKYADVYDAMVEAQEPTND